MAMLCGIAGKAQAPATYSSAEIYEQIQKLNVLGSVLYVGAHPDDENTRLLTYLSKEKKYRTAYLSLTRGDGGQNLIGDEQGVALGLVRTQELLAARRIDGAEQFFATAFDFGFSKNAEETFTIWNKEKILKDVVWVIRKFRPDVIITRFPEDARAGHGHHAASAILAREAFAAAADSTRFPDQLKNGITVWRAKRLMWNTFNFGGNNTTSTDQFTIDVGGYNAMEGKSNGEIAAQSRSQHKTQGFGSAGSRGAALEYLVPVAGEPPVKDLMDGVDVSWNRVGNTVIEEKIRTALEQFKVQDPEKSIPALMEVRKAMRVSESRVDYQYIVGQKRQELNDILQACMGLYFEATVKQQFAVVGDSVEITFYAINRSRYPVGKIRVNSGDTSFLLADTMPYNVPRSSTIKRLVRGSYMDDQPYWLRDQMTEGGFTVKSQAMVGLPQNPVNDLLVVFFLPNEVSLTTNYPIQYKYTDPVKAEQYKPFITVPSVIVSGAPGVVLTNVIPKVSPKLTVRYQSLTEKGNKPGTVVFSVMDKKLASKKVMLNLSRNSQQEIAIGLDSLMTFKANVDLETGISIHDSSGLTQTFSNNIRLINYDHIPTVHYFYQSKIKILTDEVRTVGKKIGYIKGAGDNVPEGLMAMGYEVVMLDPAEIVTAKLATFDAIITGVRAYNIHSFLSEKYEVLMNYVKNGGNLIVQYNTNNMINGAQARISPYPFVISRNRVTDEKATVNFLQPEHVVLNYPNKITAKDFEGWTQERGIYFGEQVSPVFEMPLSMADPNEAPQKGSLLIARYGKGTFVYTGLVFFRQLPAGVPGAYRLLANIIALNKKKS
ncbi:MAG: PIG-L family deacetylase [Chitinophagaceae bacterium]